MRKIIFIAILLWLSLCLSGCVQDIPPAESKTVPEPPVQSVPPPDVDPAALPPENNAETGGDNENGGDLQQIAVQEGAKVTLISGNDIVCTVELGMTLEEVEALLAETGLWLNKGSFVEDSYDNCFYNASYYLGFGNKKVDGEWVLRSISISTPAVATERGLRVGDLEGNIENMYGPCDETRADDYEGTREYIYFEEGYRILISAGDPRTDEQLVFSWAVYW